MLVHYILPGLSSKTQVLWKLSCLLEAARQSLACIRLCLMCQSCLLGATRTSYSLPLAETGYSLHPEGTSYSLPPEGTSCSLPPAETGYSLPPERTSCSLPLEGTSYSLVIASGPEVYKTKYNPDGIVERLRARLVVRGINQQEGLDYKHTFSPVAKLATVRVLIAIATSKRWPLHQLDINNAFLHGYIDEEIYMTPPEGYTKAQQGQVCKLNRSLYRLKQASMQWNQELTKFFIAEGYQQSKHDYSLFVKAKGESFSSVLVYVDDVLITGDSSHEIQHLKQALDAKFKIRIKQLHSPAAAPKI
ncbi:retrovirus-related pol polyprotein from transposon TNT 1-94 [Tanacetum coccineum]